MPHRDSHPVIVHRHDAEPLYFSPDPYGVLRSGHFILRMMACGPRVWSQHPFERHGELPNCVRIEFPDGGTYQFPAVLPRSE